MKTLLQPAADDYLTLDDIAALLRVGRSTIERLKAANKLPPCVELSRRAHRWKRSDIVAWLDAKAAGASA